MEFQVYPVVLNRDDYGNLEIDDEAFRDCLNKSIKLSDGKGGPFNIERRHNDPMPLGDGTQFKILELANKIALDIAIKFVQSLTEHEVNLDDLNVSVTVKKKELEDRQD